MKIYEVVRVIEGKILFLEDHLERFKKSLKISYPEFSYNEPEFRKNLLQFVAINNLANGNLKFEYVFSPLNQIDFNLFEIPHKYPSEEEYKYGVSASLIDANRINPEVKAEQSVLRYKAQQIISENNLADVLLVNKSGNVTEGSKSNFLLIKNNTIYTAHFSEILMGITLKHILEICKENQITVREQYLPVNTLQNFDSAFISGTSPKILPIKNIDQLNFNVNNELLRKLMLLFNQKIENYLSSH